MKRKKLNLYQLQLKKGTKNNRNPIFVYVVTG